MDGMFSCPRCSAEAAVEALTCAACGAAISSQSARTAGFDPGRWPNEGMSSAVRGGRGPLLAASILHFVSALILFNVAHEYDGGGIDDPMRWTAGIHVGVGSLFLALWAWARKAPLGASVAGLVLFLSLHVLIAILNPGSLVYGSVANILILIFLIRSVMAARASKAWAR